MNFVLINRLYILKRLKFEEEKWAEVQGVPVNSLSPSHPHSFHSQWHRAAFVTTDEPILKCCR